MVEFNTGSDRPRGSTDLMSATRPIRVSELHLEDPRSPRRTHARPMTTRSRLGVVFVAIAVVVTALAQAAAASQPLREDFHRSGTGVLSDVCSFPVTVDFTQTGTDTYFFDRNGDVERIAGHVVEQDTFTANGKTVAGSQYNFNVRVLFDSDAGVVTNVFASGVISRVRLPGGDLFLTAGRLDFVAHPGASFLIQPDVGAQGNITGFCAALS